MAATSMIKTLSLTAIVILCGVVITAPTAEGQSSTSPGAGNPTAAAPLDSSQLNALVAPIALYPDPLVAQILTAATFPDQIAVADYWLQQNKSLTGSALMQAVNGQSWDASVKALTQFPSVLDNMSKNLAWTSSLGEAYHDQQSEVMSAIQSLRAQAKAQGTLTSSSQIQVVQQSPDVIVIQPTNPQVVYVPEYNPAVVYGTPYVVPNYVAPVYSAGDVAAAGLIGFSAGIAIGAMMHGGCCSWGYSSWNCGWHGTAVVYHGGAYYGNPAWHGGYYNGGYHSSYGYDNAYNHAYNNSYNHYNSSYNHYNNAYGNKNVSGNTVNVNKSSPENSWGQRDNSTHSSAFSGMGGGHSGGFGNSGGWQSRADSGRGWGSMNAGGFGGGRFGGGGFGGGRFGGRR